jgi:hypothetical protein
VILGFLTMRYHEVKGHWPLIKGKKRHSNGDLKNHVEKSPNANGVLEVKDSIEPVLSPVEG